MKPRLPAAVLPVLLACACATPLEIERPEHVFETELRDFQYAQQVFREQNMGTHRFDFEGHGRIDVREITLDGYPGNTYVRCRFHFQNRTAKPIVQTWVHLDVLNADGEMVSSQEAHLVVPVLAMPIARGSYYSDEIRTRTFDAHLEEGWSWRIRCTSDLEEDEEPLNPPARPTGTIKLRAPMKIKDRNFPHYRQNGSRSLRTEGFR